MSESKRQSLSCKQIQSLYRDLFESLRALQGTIEHKIESGKMGDDSTTVWIETLSGGLKKSIERLKEAMKDEDQIRFRKRFFNEFKKKFNLEYVGEFDSTGIARARNTYGAWLVVNKNGDDVMKGERFAELKPTRDGLIIGKNRAEAREKKELAPYRVLKADGSMVRDSRGAGQFMDVEYGSNRTLLVSVGYNIPLQNSIGIVKSFINDQGKILATDDGWTEFVAATPLSEGSAWVGVGENPIVWMIMTQDGKILEDPEDAGHKEFYFEEVRQFHDNRALVKSERKRYHYLDTEGDQAFSKSYYEATDFYQKRAWVQEKPDEEFSYDEAEKPQLPEIYQIDQDGKKVKGKDGRSVMVRGKIEGYSEGILRLFNTETTTSSFVDLEGRVVASGFDRAKDFQEGVALVIEAGSNRAAYIDKKGNKMFV